MHILVTGAAGFIGFHLCRKLLGQGLSVVGIDNLNDYYDVNLKMARLALLEQEVHFRFQRLDIADSKSVDAIFITECFSHVVNLAAQAGVRYSLQNPGAYIQANLVGFANILEGCRRNGVKHLVYASSSSVYGLNTSMPFSVSQNVDHPASLYAATKKSNELMAHTYSHLYNLPTTGLRFFTAYGPWGRPDMALFLFTKAILEDRPIDVFNNGYMWRDFTYIDDIVEGVARILMQPAEPDRVWSGGAPNPASSLAPYRLYNIGNNNAVRLDDLILALECALGRQAQKRMLPMQPGDVLATHADVEPFTAAVGFSPCTPISKGIAHFVSWYREYYKV